MTKEELEKATGQELIEERNYCGADGYYGDYLDNVNAEMLKRFNRLADLEKENEELRNNGFTVSAMTEQQLKVALEKGEQLEKDFRICEKNADTYYYLLSKATEIIKELLLLPYANNEEVFADVTSTLNKAEQFLKEIEK